MMRLHATCVAVNGRGVLITGPSGSGKSDLALRLIDRGADLVSDDGVDIARVGGRLIATAPDAIAGRIEVRGIGIVRMAAGPAPVSIALALDQPVDRMPPDRLPETEIEGIGLPTLAFSAFGSSAVIKVEQALARWGLPV